MDTETAYQSALDYLYSFIDFSMQRNYRLAPDQFDLGRMVALLARLDNPHFKYPVIHVAGTKGKGSVSAMCASVLRQSGYKVGLYTSPHLLEYTERIQINGEEISRLELVNLVDMIKPHVAEIPRLTTYEIGTALAFWYFARQNVDAAVIEVGLGGRLDSSNVVLPVVAVITSLSYDHAEILGDTLALIAGEKAGIIKSDTPVVLAPQKEEARRVIQKIAAERKSPLIQVGKDVLYAKAEHSLDGQTFFLWESANQDKMSAFLETGSQEEEWQPDKYQIPLLGYHQIENAATAFAALQVFSDRALPIMAQAYHSGFQKVSWPGRFQLLQRAPAVVVDSAHNRDSALKLRLALDDYFPDQPVVMIFGASADKDIQGMYAELLPRVERLITTASYHPRAAEPEKLAEQAHEFGMATLVTNSLEEALPAALASADEHTVILVTGSIFVAAGAIQVWKTRLMDITEQK